MSVKAEEENESVTTGTIQYSCVTGMNRIDRIKKF